MIQCEALNGLIVGNYKCKCENRSHNESISINGISNISTFSKFCLRCAVFHLPYFLFFVSLFSNIILILFSSFHISTFRISFPYFLFILDKTERKPYFPFSSFRLCKNIFALYIIQDITVTSC